MRQMEVAGVHVEQDSNVPVVLLRELAAPHRILPIHIGGPEAAAIAMALTGHVPPRPLAHDVMAQLVGLLHARVDAAEVLAVRNGTFIAQLSLSGPNGQEHVDTRASDAIALAMRVGAPVLVAEAVLVAAGAAPEPLVLRLDDDLDELDGDLDDELDQIDRPGAHERQGVPRDRDGRIGDDAELERRIAAARAGERRRLADRLEAQRRERDLIERRVEEFRAFLDDLEPSDFDL